MGVIKFYKQKQKAPLIIDYNHNNKVNEILFVTIQGIVNGALLSAAIIPSKTGNPFFLIVEM